MALAFRTTPAAGGPEFEYDTLVVRAYFDDYQRVEDLATWTEPWEVDLEGGFVIVDVNETGYERLVSAGFGVEIDLKLTAQRSMSQGRCCPDRMGGSLDTPATGPLKRLF
jgi:hypothetical protein